MLALTEPTQQQLTDAPWMIVARGEHGQKEAPGAADNPRIVEYIRSCDKRGRRPWLLHDATPHCSAFCNFCMDQIDLAGTGSLAARSWLDYGEPIKRADIRYGDVVVLWRGVPIPATVRNAHGHVGFVDSWDERAVNLLGGNQNDRVSVQAYPWKRVLGIRRPHAGEVALLDLPGRAET